MQSDSKKKFVPFPGFILIKPEENQKEVDGILLSEDAEIRSYFGTVVAVGEERQGEKNIAKVGDRVLYNKMSANELTIGEEKLAFYRVTDMLAVVES